MTDELLTNVTTALDAVDARDVRRDGAYTVWHLNEPGLFARSGGSRRQAVQQCKRRLLELFAETGSAYLCHSEDPAESGANGPWVPGQSQTTALPTKIDLDDQGTQYWLFSLGNWHAYVAPAAIHYAAPASSNARWPAPARSRAEALRDWMPQVGILALIDSFHDDVSWVVAVAGGPIR